MKTNKKLIEWSISVRGNYSNKCAVCGKGGKIDAHHHIPKELLINGDDSHRYDVKNGIALCPRHHKFCLQSAHKNYIWFYEWMLKNEPKTIKYLKNQYKDAFNEEV